MEKLEQVLQFPQLPSYLSVTFRTEDGGFEGGTVKVTIHSTIHVNKSVEMPNQWTVGFVDRYPNRFMGDVLRYVVKQYGLSLSPPKYQ